MAALSSIGTLLGAGATIYAQQRARQAQYNTQLAQAEANQAVEVALPRWFWMPMRLPFSRANPRLCST